MLIKSQSIFNTIALGRPRKIEENIYQMRKPEISKNSFDFKAWSIDNNIYLYKNNISTPFCQWPSVNQPWRNVVMLRLFFFSVKIIPNPESTQYPTRSLRWDVMHNYGWELLEACHYSEKFDNHRHFDC